MRHLAAYYESVDNGGAYGRIAAVPDEQVFTSGDDIRVPDEIANIIGAAFLTDASTLTAARLTSPTLRQLANPNFEPCVNALVFGSLPEISFFPTNPMKLNGNESLRCEINSDDAAAQDHYGLVWLSDGAQPPVNGDIFSVRGTAAATLAAGQWVNSGITFESTLPDGQYQVVGLSVRGTNLVAARLSFIGGKWRPGVPAVNAIGDVGFRQMRYGGAGVLGEFDTNQPPSLDCLGVTDTAQDIILDLIRIS